MSMSPRRFLRLTRLRRRARIGDRTTQGSAPPDCSHVWAAVTAEKMICYMYVNAQTKSLHCDPETEVTYSLCSGIPRWEAREPTDT